MNSPSTTSARRPALEPLADTSTFADRAYTALKGVIVSLNVYDQPDRRPSRRAAARAGTRDQPHAGARGDGAARTRRLRALGAAPRHLRRAQDASGEVIDMITAWAALESMAARLITHGRERQGNRHAPRHVRQHSKMAKYMHGSTNIQMPISSFTRPSSG